MSTWVSPTLTALLGLSVILALLRRRQLPGDLLEHFLRGFSRRALGVYRGFRSYRVAYQSEVVDVTTEEMRRRWLEQEKGRNP